MKLLAVLGFTIVGLTLAALWHLWPWPQAEGNAALVPRLIVLLAATAAVYLAAVFLVLRRRLPRQAIWLVLIVAAAVRLAMLFTPPILSSDIYRYIWDGRVQLAGINPYLFVPADPALAQLRDAAIYPHINRANYAHTIYPPMAQLVFAAGAGVAQTVFAEKAVMVGFDVAAILLAQRLLRLARLPPERVLIYAWNPVPLWAFACDGHLDAIGIALLAGALLLRCQTRDGAAGVAFGAAVLVKFLPLVVAPALWRRRAGWRLAAACVATVVGLYACYAGAGRHVLGFLPGYGAEEGIDDGSGIWLLAGLQHLGVPAAAVVAPYFAALGLALAGLGLWFMARPRPWAGTPEDAILVCGQAAILAAAVTVIVSPHYAWYFAWLALPVVIRPFWSVIWLATAPIVLYHDPFDDPFWWRCVVYLPAALLAVVDLRRAAAPLSGLLPVSHKGIS